jgi:hypothetical protein
LRFNKNLYNRLNKKVIFTAALSIIGILVVVLIIPTMNVKSVSIANSITNTGSINSVSTSEGKEEESSIVPLDQIVSGGPSLYLDLTLMETLEHILSKY